MKAPSPQTTIGRILKKEFLPIFDILCPDCDKAGIKSGFRKTGRMIPDAMEKDKLIDEMERAVGPEFNEKSTEVRDIREGNNTLNFDLPGMKK